MNIIIRAMGKVKTNNRIEMLYASKGDMKGEIDLTWNPVLKATGYIIQVSAQSGKDNWKEIDIVTRSHYTVTGLRSNAQYKFRAAPICSEEKSEWSSTVTEKAS